jgi:hypothetical protein
VITRNDQQGFVERPEQRGGAVMLCFEVSVGEVAARDHELGLGLGDERAKITLDLRLLLRSSV